MVEEIASRSAASPGRALLVDGGPRPDRPLPHEHALVPPPCSVHGRDAHPEPVSHPA